MDRVKLIYVVSVDPEVSLAKSKYCSYCICNGRSNHRRKLFDISNEPRLLRSRPIIAPDVAQRDILFTFRKDSNPHCLAIYDSYLLWEVPCPTVCALVRLDRIINKASNGSEINTLLVQYHSSNDLGTH